MTAAIGAVLSAIALGVIVGFARYIGKKVAERAFEKRQRNKDDGRG